MRSRIRGPLVGTLVAVAASLLWIPSPALADADGYDNGFESDFNGDGFSDTVVADPYATVGGHAQAGQVIVLYGDADGRIGEGATRGTLSQNSVGVGNAAEANDRFGFALAVANIDCDEHTDLVVGTPYEDVSGQVDSGYAQIIWGSAGGLGESKSSRNLTQSNFSIPVVAGDAEVRLGEVA